MRFVSIGECMTELAPAETPGQFSLGFAGDTFNTAWYLRTLRPDITTCYFTRVGTDPMSDQMLAVMSETGIDTRFVARDPQRTVGLYLISLQDGERSFSYWRETSAARHLARDPALLTQALDGADLIYFSGITLAILDFDGRKTLLGALETARSKGKTIAFDSNLRPRLWGSTDEMTATIMQAASVSDLVLPSFEDEATSFGDTDIEATGTRYLQAGAATVVVKNGPDPIRFWHNGTHGQVLPPQVEPIVDSTAAGDSFNAGFLAGLDRKRPINEVIQAASHVAAQVIGQKGALVPLDRAEIANWLGTTDKT